MTPDLATQVAVLSSQMSDMREDVADVKRTIQTDIAEIKALLQSQSSARDAEIARLETLNQAQERRILLLEHDFAMLKRITWAGLSAGAILAAETLWLWLRGGFG